MVAIALEQWQQATVKEFVTPLMVVVWVRACVRACTRVCARLCVCEELKDVVNLIFHCKVLRASEKMMLLIRHFLFDVTFVRVWMVN